MKTNKIYNFFNPDKTPVLFYSLLTCAFVYSFFHFALLPYFTKSETDYWFKYFTYYKSVSGFNLTHFLTKIFLAPFLCFTEVQMSPLRLVYSLIAWCIVFSLYWSPFSSTQRTFKERFVFCLIISTMPVLILQRGLPEGFITLLNLSLSIGFFSSIIKLFQDEKNNQITRYIYAIILTAINGLLIPTLLFAFSGIVYLHKKERIHDSLIIAYISALSFLVFKFIFNFEFSSFCDSSPIVFDPSGSISKLYNTVGIYGIAALPITIVYLFKSFKRSNPEIFTITRLLIVYTTLVILVPSAIPISSGINIALTARLISIGVIDTLDQKLLHYPKIRYYASTILFALFVLFPFSTSIKIHNSFLSDLSASVLENKSIIKADHERFANAKVKIFGSSFDSTSTFLLSLASIRFGSPVDQIAAHDTNIIYLSHRNNVSNIDIKIVEVRGDLIFFKADHPLNILKKKAGSFEEAKALLLNKINSIEHDIDWLNSIKTKSEKNGIAFEKQLRDDALWTLLSDSLISTEFYDRMKD
jgi:hypothetical protein